MSECICSSCRNLKSKINDEGEGGEFDCEFGLPSSECESCAEDDCELTCDHYIADDQEDEVRVVKCHKCGKELTQVCSNHDEEGEVFCINCYLSNEG